jgi:hypothetical protein
MVGERMDVTKLQKMNALASTLKQHGLASGREDAALQAGNIVGVFDSDDEISRVFVAQNQVVKAEEKIEKVVHPGIDEAQVKVVLQAFADQFVTEINKMAQRLDSYESLLVKMQQEQKQTVVIQHAPEPVQHEAAPVEVQAAPEHHEVKKETHTSPRSGNFKSNDVAIEKFFYYGNK